MGKRKGQSKRRSKAVHRVRVWGYPRTEDNDGPIDWTWACRCGARGQGMEEDVARAAASDHLEDSSWSRVFEGGAEAIRGIGGDVLKTGTKP